MKLAAGFNIWGLFFRYCSSYKATLLGKKEGNKGWKTAFIRQSLSGLMKRETRSCMQRWPLRRSVPTNLPWPWIVSALISPYRSSIFLSAMAMDSECFHISLCLLYLLRCPDKMLNLTMYFRIKITNAMVKMFRLDFKFNHICPDWHRQCCVQNIQIKFGMLSYVFCSS